MARTWGVVRGKFWDLDTSFPETPTISHGGATTLEAVVDGSVNFTRYMGGVGNGSASFYAVDGWDTFLQPGHVCLIEQVTNHSDCLLYTSPSPRDGLLSRMPSSA